MRPASEDPALASWRELQERLAGYFAARSRGLLASEFILSGRSGEEFGWLRVYGLEGAEFESPNAKAAIERTARSRYRMLTGDAETLVAEPAMPSGALMVKRGNHLYETRFDLLRNAATSRSTGGEEAARIVGGLTNLNYEAFFDAGDEGSLPVAIFLLYRIVALRRRAFLADARGGEASSP